MSKKPMQKVVVIQDASKGISLSALEWALTGLELKPGDELILLSVLHQVNTPSTFSMLRTRTLLGYKMKVISSTISGANKAVIKEAVQKKKEEYQNNLELVRINDIYEANKIEFSVLVIPASSPKIVALEAAKALQATWIILDRQLKKDRKYFLEKLNCGISRMKRDDSVELLREPKSTSTETTNNMKRDGSRSSFVTYDEMLPGIPDEDDLFSLELAPKNSSSPNKISKAGKEQTTDAQKESIKRKCISKSTIASNYLLHIEEDSSKANNVHDMSTAKEKHSPPLAHRKDHELEANALTNAIVLNPTLEQVKDIEVISSHSSSTRPKKSIEYYPDNFSIELAQCQELTRNSACSECGNERPKIDRIREFTFGELYVATEKFARRNFLSEGGFGPVYQGKLMDGPRIAVKQHKHLSSQGEKEFKREVQVLSKARHKNVVMLLGSCAEGNHRLLVYEYVCNKSLDHHLSDKSTEVLRWPDRLKIALGAAKGLQYLHLKGIIHRDMRPSNILVTHDYEPMLGDFGLARTQNSGLGGSSETRVVGTVGYVAPEYAESGKVSKKSDVYSFGVVLLELLSGRTTLDKSLENNSLVGWAKPLLVEGNYQELIDPKIMESHDVHQLFGMVQIIESCLSKDPKERPPMDKVAHDLNCVMGGQRVTGVKGYFSPPLTTMSDGKKLSVDEAESDEDYLTAKDYNTCTSEEEEAPHHGGPKTRTSEVKTSPASAAKTVFPITGSWKGFKNKRGKSAGQIFYGEMLS